MSGPNFVLDKGYKVASATAVTQFQVVKLSADDTVTPVSATTDQPIGVAQEACAAADATLGKVINIRMFGISRCVAGGSITRGDIVKPNASGAVIVAPAVAGTNDKCLGIALVSGVSGDHIDVAIVPGLRNNAAAS